MTTLNANPAPRAAPPDTPPAPAPGASRRAWLLRIAGALVFVALIAFLVWRGQLQPARIVDILAHANPLLVALSVLLYFPFVLIKSERWRLLAAGLGIHMDMAEAWRLYAVGLGAGAFTPGQAGDLIKAWALQRRGARLGAAIASSVLDRVCDLAGLAALAALGVWVFGRTVVGDLGTIVLLGLGAILAVALFARRDLLLRYLRRRGVAGSGQQAAGSNERVDDDQVSALGTDPATRNTQHATRRLLTGHWSLVTGLTVVSFVVSTFRVWLLALAIGLALDPATVGGLTGLTTVAALIPISVSGVGTRDTAMVALIAQLGQTAAEAVALSTLILLLNVANAVFGYAVWWVETRIGAAPARQTSR